MAKVNMAAVRAFNRALRPISEAQDVAARADAGFDGGEWSAAWHDELADTAMIDLAGRVAPRFGMTTEDLLDDVTAAAYINSDCTLAAYDGRAL